MIRKLNEEELRQRAFKAAAAVALTLETAPDQELLETLGNRFAFNSKGDMILNPYLDRVGDALVDPTEYYGEAFADSPYFNQPPVFYVNVLGYGDAVLYSKHYAVNATVILPNPAVAQEVFDVVVHEAYSAQQEFAPIEWEQLIARWIVEQLTRLCYMAPEGFWLVFDGKEHDWTDPGKPQEFRESAFSARLAIVAEMMRKTVHEVTMTDYLTWLSKVFPNADFRTPKRHV